MDGIDKSKHVQPPRTNLCWFQHVKMIITNFLIIKINKRVQLEVATKCNFIRSGIWPQVTKTKKRTERAEEQKIPQI